jgi:hypothetical protein
VYVEFQEKERWTLLAIMQPAQKYSKVVNLCSKVILPLPPPFNDKTMPKFATHLSIPYEEKYQDINKI